MGCPAEVAAEVAAAFPELLKRLQLHRGDVSNERLRPELKLLGDHRCGDIRRHAHDDKARGRARLGDRDAGAQLVGQSLVVRRRV